MKKELNSSGLTLVELMMVAGALAGVALIVMQLNKEMLKTQNDATSNYDYIQLQSEVNFIISDANSCSASLSGVTFNGASIRSTPVNGIELWTANQTGGRSRKKIYTGQTYGKTTTSSLSLSMPDYTAGVNFPQGTNQSFKAELQITGSKVSMGKSKSFSTITQPLHVVFDTNASGVSTIKSCTVNTGYVAPTYTENSACDASQTNIAVDSSGKLLTCQGGVWKSATGSSGGTKFFASQGGASCSVTSRRFGINYTTTVQSGETVNEGTCDTIKVYICVDGTYQLLLTMPTAPCEVPQGTCFPSGTKVLMASGIKKDIEEIKPGEKVIGMNGSVNTVVGTWRPLLGDRKLYRINKSFATTGDHMLLTRNKLNIEWGALSPDLYNERRFNIPVKIQGADNNFLEIMNSTIESANIVKLNLGSQLVDYQGIDRELSSIDEVTDVTPSTQLYTLKTDGTESFVVEDGYVVDGMPQKQY